MYERVIVGVVVLCACLFLARKLRKTLRGESCSECCGRSYCSENCCCHARPENQAPGEGEENGDA